MSETSTIPDIQLELKERINYPNILQTSMLNQKSLMKEKDFNIERLHLMILDEFYDIPNSWYDPQFAKDVKGVITKTKVANIIKFAGVPLSERIMKKRGYSLTKDITHVHYFKLKLAIRNLLDRRNMLIRKDKIEMTTGKNLEIQSLDDIIDELNEDEEE